MTLVIVTSGRFNPVCIERQLPDHRLHGLRLLSPNTLDAFASQLFTGAGSPSKLIAQIKQRRQRQFELAAGA